MNAKIWLQEKLSDGELHLCESIREAAKEDGISKKDLKAARKELGVKTHHQFDEYGETPNWFWYMGA